MDITWHMCIMWLFSHACIHVHSTWFTLPFEEKKNVSTCATVTYQLQQQQAQVYQSKTKKKSFMSG